MSGLTLLNGLLTPEARPWEVEPGLFSLYPPGEGANAFDLGGAFSLYDAVACHPLYNRLVWGYRTSEYPARSARMLEHAGPGWILDAGCGSLAFTADLYATLRDRPAVLLDQSLTLLRKARQRLMSLAGRLPDNLLLVHGDALRTGFRAEVFSGVVCLNLLHVLTDLPAFFGELARITRAASPLLFTTLVQAGRLADGYLMHWAKAGELVPRTPEQVRNALRDAGLDAECAVMGSLVFAQARFAGR